ncbi:hypothetical protein ABE021_07940 [Sporosarcina gallistercoris]|uniref:hypothetical protein n=1 Tax=Sporosarcina gallistercoris TaxID=2762245 RepID=UPI003D2C4F14
MMRCASPKADFSCGTMRTDTLEEVEIHGSYCLLAIVVTEGANEESEQIDMIPRGVYDGVN